MIFTTSEYKIICLQVKQISFKQPLSVRENEELTRLKSLLTDYLLRSGNTEETAESIISELITKNE